jgi:hypothetical protein
MELHQRRPNGATAADVTE